MLDLQALRSLHDQAVFCERAGVPGDFVECGVWKGGAVGLMALANLKHSNARRRLHLFDSFEDICEPDATVDGERAVREAKSWSKSGGTQGRLIPLKGFYDSQGGHGTIEENKILLERRIGYPADWIQYHRGWFQETLPLASKSIDRIAILRLDSDWYASTKVCLEFLYEKVMPGGFVIIDDYGAYDGCRKAVDEFLAARQARYYLNAVNSETRYLIKTRSGS